MATENSPGIAVFGSSEPRPGDPLYETAVSLGERLAAAGFVVITGGYGGVMEAASRGARNVGGRTLGVPCSVFDERRPNPYLSQVVVSSDLYGRMRELIERASGYVVLPGKAGTLAELAQLWALERAGCLGTRPVVLLGTTWTSLVDLLESEGMLESRQIRCTRVADTPADAVEILRARPPIAGNVQP